MHTDHEGSDEERAPAGVHDAGVSRGPRRPPAAPSPAVPPSRDEIPRAVAPALSALRARYGDPAVERQLAALRQHGEAVDDPLLWLQAALAGNFKFMPIELARRCVCGGDRLRLRSRFVFWNLLGVRECQSCGLILVSPRLTADAMRRVFADTYFDYADLDVWGERRQPVFADVARLLSGLGCRSVFDVGTAFGHFVRWANDHGFQASGCDVSERAVAIGRERFGVQLFAGSVHEVPARSADSAVSLDALYYVQDPVAELRAMRRLVRPEGYLVLRLRNGRWASARAALEGRKPIGNAVMPSEHLWAFTPDTVQCLLDAGGWQLVRCEPAAYSRTPLAVVQTAAVRASRAARRAWPDAPILTRSFNVVARRAD